MPKGHRHSEFGINALHLVSVAGIYLALFAIAYALPASEWIVGCVLAVYLTVLAFNIPLRLLAASCLFMTLLLGIYRLLPQMNVWVYVITIFAWHRFQIWNHNVYHVHHDMSEFQEKYRKGPALFFYSRSTNCRFC